MTYVKGQLIQTLYQEYEVLAVLIAKRPVLCAYLASYFLPPL